MKVNSSRPISSASADSSSIPPGVDSSMKPAAMTRMKISTAAAILLANDAIPNPECFSSCMAFSLVE